MVKMLLAKAVQTSVNPRPKYFSYFATFALALCILVPVLAAGEAWEWDAVRLFLPL